MAEINTAEVMVFDGGRIYQVSSTRFRVEFGDSWREMDIDQWVSWLRYDRVAEDRKKFAAMAMQGLAGQYAQGGDFMEGHVATGAVKMADALLKELAK